MSDSLPASSSDESIPLELECSCGEVFSIDDESTTTAACPGCGEELETGDLPADDERDDEPTPWDWQHTVEEERKFFSELLPAMVYPLRGDGPFMLFGAWLLGTPLIFASRFSVLLSLILLASTSFFLAFLFDVLREGAEGSQKVPYWPDFQDDFYGFLESLRHVLCAAAAAGLPLWATSVGLLLAEEPFGHWSPVLTGLGLVLVFLLGPSLVNVALFGAWATFNYRRILSGIARTPSDSLLLFLFTLVLFGLIGAVAQIEEELPILQCVGLLPLMYLTVIYARLLGLYYFTNRHRLDWLRRK